MILVWLALAGALGTLARYALSWVAAELFGTAYPWGTLLVNSLGCFLFGLAWSLTDTRLATPPAVRLVILTGFMGAFTTFSTYIFDSASRLADAPGLAVTNLLLSNVLGLLLLLAGMEIGRRW